MPTKINRRTGRYWSMFIKRISSPLEFAMQPRQQTELPWCRRRDSNSHSFRHYPLKIACLPISPRRQFSSVQIVAAPCGFSFANTARFYPQIILLPEGNRQSHQQLFGWDLSCARSWLCRCNGSRNRRRYYDGSLKHAARAGYRTGGTKIGKQQGASEKQSGQHRRGPRKKIRTAAGAKQAAGAATAKSGTHVSTLAVLNQNQADHSHRCNHLDRKQ